MVERIIKPSDVLRVIGGDSPITITQLDDTTSVQAQALTPIRIVKPTDRRLRCGVLALVCDGEDAAVGRWITLVGDQNSYTLNFNDISAFREMLTMRAWSKALALTGTDTRILADRLLVQEVSDFALTLQDVEAYADRYLLAQNDPLAVGSGSADLIVQRYLPLDAAAFVWSTSAAGLLVDRWLTAAPAALGFSGSAAGLLADRWLTAAPAAFLVNAEPVTLVVAMGVETATFTLTLQEATLRGQMTLHADAAAFAITAQPAGMSTSRPIVADVGEFTLASSDISFSWDHQLDAETASFGLVGVEPYFPQDYRLDADTLRLTVGSSDTDIYSVNIPLVADTAVFSVGTELVDFGKQKLIVATRRNLTLRAKAATLIRKWRLFADRRAYTLGRKQAYFKRNRIMQAEVRNLIIADQNVNLKLNEQKNTVMPAAKRALSVSMKAANLVYKWRMTAAKQAFTLTPRSVAFVRTFGFSIAPDTATFTITTNAATLTPVRLYRMTAAARSYSLGVSDTNYIWLRHYWLTATNTQYIVEFGAITSEVIATDDDDYTAWVAAA